MAAPQALFTLAERTGRIVDLAYSALVHQLGLTQAFFQKGFGELGAIDMHREVETFRSWPPPHFQGFRPGWQRVKRGEVGGAAYSIYRGSFQTPCTGRVYDALPLESRFAHAMWLVPERPAEGAPCVIHLAATGDHGFIRRMHLGLPLVPQGVATLALESPFYGLRKPAYQQGAKLHHVSDLLLLGRATIEESLLLLNWLADSGGAGRLGMAGLSMGGVHASMVASLYPGAVSLTPLLAPRSAATAYCGGALYHATCWQQLRQDAERREREIVAVVQEMAREKAGGLAAARVRAAAGSAAQGEGSAAAAAAVQTARQAADTAAAVEAAAGAAPRSTDGDGGVAGGGGDGSAKGLSSQWQATGGWVSSWVSSFSRQMGQVVQLERERNHEGAVLLLREVLETWTDVTRFPRPQRPDAAVLVGATEDAYVSRESILELHRHLTGSEVRWVPGGHVSSFLLHHSAFRQAILDSLARLDQPLSLGAAPEAATEEAEAGSCGEQHMAI
eukprot:scaffold1.g5866.t1